MTKYNITYREALQVYLANISDENKNNEIGEINTSSMFVRDVPQNCNDNIKTYSYVVSTTPKYKRHAERASDSMTEKNANFLKKKIENVEHQNKRKKDCKYISQENNLKTTEVLGNNSNMSDESISDNSKLQTKFNFMKLLIRIKNIIMSNQKLEDKIYLGLKAIFEECKGLIIDTISEGDMLENFFNIFYGTEKS